jgi:uncharacterized protein (TIGR02231 family)
MQLTYNALVRQNSGEAWDEVSVKLSTAQVSLSGTQPEMSPWYIAVAQNRPPTRAAGAMYKERAAAPMQMYEKRLDADNELAAEAPAPAPMQVATAAVETRATSVVFVVPGKSTINSDNTDYRMTVATIDFPVTMRYSSVPKLAPYAYLKAKASNSSEYVLLPGTSNIFFDNHFVAQARLDLVSPAQEFWTYLGTDEGLKVERKTIKRRESNEGVFGKKARVEYEFQIVVKNNKKSAEEIVVWDQIPISNNEQIAVTLLEPQNMKDTAVVKMNEFK